MGQIKKDKEKKIFREIPRANAYIYSTYNNTIITITDQDGNVIASSSAGKVGFSGPKKATPHAAGIIVRDAWSRIKNSNIREIQIFVKGVGTGRESAIRAFAGLGINISSIKDITPIPHNGCRPPKVRRV